MQPTAEEIVQVLTWKVGDQQFGMLVTQCREVVENVTIEKVPHAPPYVAGICNLRGDVVTIINLRIKLGYTPKPLGDHNVIVRLKDPAQQIALLADEVSDIVEVAASKIEKPPANLGDIEQQFISAVCTSENGLVIILDGEMLKVPEG